MKLLDFSWQTSHPRTGELAYLAPGIFLFILPFAGTVALRLSALAIAGITAFIVLYRTEHPPVPLKIPTALWAVVALLSLIWAHEPSYSAGEIKNEIGYTIVAYLAFYALTAGKRQWDIWNGFLTAGLITVSAAAARHFMAGNAYGLYVGPGPFSTYLILLSPLIFLALDQSFSEKRGRIRYCALAVLLMISGYTTLNRAFWIALVTSSVVYLALRLHRFRRLRFSVIVPVLLLSAAILFGGLLAVMGTRFSTDASFQSVQQILSRDPRMELWKFSLDQILSNPVIGAGFGNWSSHVVFAGQNFQDDQSWHAHNMLLNYGLQMGFPGMIVLLCLLFAIAREFIVLYQAGDETCSALGAAGLALLVGAIGKSMTDSLIGRNNALLFWALAGMILGYGRRLRAEYGVKPAK